MDQNTQRLVEGGLEIRKALNAELTADNPNQPLDPNIITKIVAVTNAWMDIATKTVAPDVRLRLQTTKGQLNIPLNKPFREEDLSAYGALCDLDARLNMLAGLQPASSIVATQSNIGINIFNRNSNHDQSLQKTEISPTLSLELDKLIGML